MLNKFDVQFEGTLDEFNAWAASVFKDAGKFRVKVEVRPATGQPADPLVQAVAETFRREITVEIADEIRKFIAEGNRIAGIKVLRTATGLGLDESKNFLDTRFPHK